MRLSKEQIFSIAPALKEVEVPEWGGSVFIRPITLGEQARLTDLSIRYEKESTLKKLKNGTLMLIQLSVCDQQGQPLFGAEDVDKLMDRAASPFLRLQDEILSLSGLTKESREDLEKNLLPTPPAKPVSQ